MAKLWQFSQGRPKAPFCEKVQRRDQGNFLKNHTKSSPPFKNPTAQQMALSSNQYALVVQRMEKILAQKAVPKGPEWPSYGNFGKVTQNPHFLKKCKGGPKDIFQKSSKKRPSIKRANSTLAKKALSFNQNAVKVQRLEKILAQKAAPIMPEWPRYGNFCKVTQNPHFLKKFKGGTKGNFLKNRPESSPRLNGLRALCRKWHYPSISMHLKCEDWRRF